MKKDGKKKNEYTYNEKEINTEGIIIEKKEEKITKWATSEIKNEFNLDDHDGAFESLNNEKINQ